MALWDYPTNFSGGQNSSSLGGLFKYMGYATGGYFGLGALAVIFFMVFGITALVDFKKSFLSASFVTFMFSVYFLGLGLINPAVVFGLVIAIIIGVLMNLSSGGSNF